MQSTKPRRRSAKEWQKLVRAWRRSGLPAGEFAAHHGVKAQTLSWWRWQLGAERVRRPAKRKVAKRRAPRLVAVEVSGPSSGAGDRSTPTWELVMASGHTLRAYRGAERAELLAVAELLARHRGAPS
jgi:hypothetical protein